MASALTAARQAAHTPGPWSVVSDREDELKVRSAEDEFIADCADGFWSDDLDGWVMAHESEANARLIHAAPELLAALKALVANINEFGAVTDGEFIDQADAAIAKALVK